MTREQLKAKFPNASETFLNANATFLDCPPSRSRNQEGQSRHSDQGSERRDQGADRPKLESGPCNGALEPSRIQASPVRNVLVRVKAIRKRLLDQDNLCEKYVVDLLRNAGIIHDDAPDKTQIEVCQEKAGKGQSERVEIEVYEITK